MSKPSGVKIGYVLIKQNNKGKWIAAWWNKEKNVYERRPLPAASFDEAKQIASEINTQLAVNAGFLPRLRNNKCGISIVEAFTQTINNSRAGDRCQKEYKFAANSFIYWLHDNHPGVESWGALRPSHISGFVKACESEGLAFDSIRKRLYIIKAASRFMADEYESFRDIARKVKTQKPETPLDGAALTISRESVRALIEHASERDIDKAAMLSLMAYSGLRIYEAAHLRECDIDLQAATIKIDDTPHHKAKTSGSKRLIPIPRQVCQILQSVISKNKVRGVDCYIFQSGRRATTAANIGQGWSKDGLSHILRRAVHEAYRDTRRDDLKGFIPRHLRSFFVSTITAAGASDVFIRRYIGHAPASVMERHYLKLDTETLRKEICGRIEAILSGERAELEGGLPDLILHKKEMTY